MHQSRINPGSIPDQVPGNLTSSFTDNDRNRDGIDGAKDWAEANDLKQTWNVQISELPSAANTFRVLLCSGEATPTFGHANANFSVFINHIRKYFLKKLIMIMI